MELVQSLLNSHVNITEHNGFSFDANQVLIEQLLANFKIERADLESMVESINGMASERIKSSLLNRLGDFTTSGRFAIQCLDRDQFTSNDEYIANLYRSLDYKYWHTLFNRLNIHSVIPFNDSPKLDEYLTLYTSENPIDFNLEEIQKLLLVISDDLFNAKTLKVQFRNIVENYKLVFERMKNGDLKILMKGTDHFKCFKNEISDLIAGALYFNDTEWYLNSKQLPKNVQTDLKGVEWTKFKNSNHILTLNKTTADIFLNFYGIKPQ